MAQLELSDEGLTETGHNAWKKWVKKKMSHTIDDENIEPKSDEIYTKNGNTFLSAKAVCL